MSPSLTVRVGATSANLGSGFDAIGICLDWYDTLQCKPSSRTTVEVLGPATDQVPRNEDHLVVRSIRAGLRSLGANADQGLELVCRNSIPHARGLGSSAAAIVAGLSLAWGMARGPEPLDREWVAHEAITIEGHPDNVLPATLGGAVLAWRSATPGRTDHLRLEVADHIQARVWVPETQVPTATARKVLPESLDRSTATAQAVSLALLVNGLQGREGLLFAGTEGEWHQRARAPLMPASAALVAALREEGVAAAISGAGPSVVALGTTEQLSVADRMASPGFVSHRLCVGQPAVLTVDDRPIT